MKTINIKLNRWRGEEVDDDAREIMKGIYEITSTQDEPYWMINGLYNNHSRHRAMMVMAWPWDCSCH